MKPSQKVLEKVPQYTGVAKLHIVAYCKRHKFVLIALVRYALIAVIIPWLLAVFFLPEYVRAVLIFTISLTTIFAIVRYSMARARVREEAGLTKKQERKVTSKSQPTRRELARQRKIEIADAKEQEMLKFINGDNVSILARIHSGLRKEDFDEHCLIDQAPHWVVAVLLFFNPMSLRGDYETPAKDRKPALNFSFGLMTTIKYLWIIGWVITVISVPVAIFFPGLEYYYSIGEVMWTALGVMSTWTIVWGFVAIYLWLHERYVATKHQFTLVTKRWPFQIVRAPVVGVDKLISAYVEQGFWGNLFGYGTLIIETPQQTEAVGVVHYVKDPKRTETVMNALSLEGGARYS